MKLFISEIPTPSQWMEWKAAMAVGSRQYCSNSYAKSVFPEWMKFRIPRNISLTDLKNSIMWKGLYLNEPDRIAVEKRTYTGADPCQSQQGQEQKNKETDHNFVTEAFNKNHLGLDKRGERARQPVNQRRGTCDSRNYGRQYVCAETRNLHTRIFKSTIAYSCVLNPFTQGGERWFRACIRSITLRLRIPHHWLAEWPRSCGTHNDNVFRMPSPSSPPPQWVEFSCLLLMPDFKIA